tara:strand:+ start:1642 stop:2064 length:423 start_codon:yes stop_codon:yes gene_type:complete
MLNDIIFEYKKVKTNKKDIRNFAFIIGLILFSIAVFLFFKDKELYEVFLYISGFFMFTGVLLPVILKPIYLLWMIFAIILGWIMTRVILSILFYIIITPIGLITRLLGEDFLSLKKIKADSYWSNRNSSEELNQNYEQQF